MLIEKTFKNCTSKTLKKFMLFTSKLFIKIIKLSDV